MNYKLLADEMRNLALKHKGIKDFRLCDYDVILANQTNIKYPCLWMEDTPTARIDDEGTTTIFTFTLAILWQEPTLEKDRFNKSQDMLDILIEYVNRLRYDTDGYNIVGAEYACDFSLSNDKDLRWRVELAVTMSSCDEVHAEKWTDL